MEFIGQYKVIGKTGGSMIHNLFIFKDDTPTNNYRVIQTNYYIKEGITKIYTNWALSNSSLFELLTNYKAELIWKNNDL